MCECALPEALDEQLWQDVEVLLIIMEEVFNELKHFDKVFQLKLIFVNQIYYLKNGRLKHGFITPLEGDLTRIKNLKV